MILRVVNSKNLESNDAVLWLFALSPFQNNLIIDPSKPVFTEVVTRTLYILVHTETDLWILTFDTLNGSKTAKFIKNISVTASILDPLQGWISKIKSGIMIIKADSVLNYTLDTNQL